MMAEEHQDKYKLIFTSDLNFSKKFEAEIRYALSVIRLPPKIINNLGTYLDLKKGEDLSMREPLSRIGTRIRRYYSEKGFCYKTKNEFTQDFKEQATAELDRYFYGYSNPQETGLDSYIIFDYADFLKGRKNGKIPIKDTPKNNNHSQVSFNCWSLKGIEKHCRIFRKHGIIGRLKTEIPGTETKLPDYWY